MRLLYNLRQNGCKVDHHWQDNNKKTNEESSSTWSGRFSGKKKPPNGLARERKSHRCGCKFKVNFSRYNNKNSTDKRVVLTKANYRHCHGCRPSSNQLLVHHVKSGTHTRTNAIASDRIQALINMHRFGDYVDAKSIRNALKDALPDNYPITAGLIANVRARVKKAAESY